MSKGRSAELNCIEIDVASPGNFVHVRLTRAERVKVIFDPALRNAFDQDTAAEEVEQAVMQAWRQYAIQAEEIRQRWSDHSFPSREEAGDLPDWLRSLREELNDIEANGQSSQKHVSATAYGDGDLVVTFQDNAVRRTDISTDQLGLETTEAIDHAKRNQASATQNIYNKYWLDIKSDWKNRVLNRHGR